MSNGFRKPREVASLVQHGQAVSPDEIYHAIMFPQKEIERLQKECDEWKREAELRAKNAEAWELDRDEWKNEASRLKEENNVLRNVEKSEIKRLEKENEQLKSSEQLLIKIKNAWIGIEFHDDPEKAREMAEDFYTIVQDILAGDSE